MQLHFCRNDIFLSRLPNRVEAALYFAPCETFLSTRDHKEENLNNKSLLWSASAVHGLETKNVPPQRVFLNVSKRKGRQRRVRKNITRGSAVKLLAYPLGGYTKRSGTCSACRTSFEPLCSGACACDRKRDSGARHAPWVLRPLFCFFYLNGFACCVPNWCALLQTQQQKPWVELD